MSWQVEINKVRIPETDSELQKDLKPRIYRLILPKATNSIDRVNPQPNPIVSVDAISNAAKYANS